MSRAARALGALTVPALAVPVAVPLTIAVPLTAAGAVTVPKPPTKPLPSALDVASPYVGQRLCDPTAKPGVVSFAKLMASHYNRSSYGISRACSYGVTEHSEGRALDWMLDAGDPYERAVADSVVRWLTAADSSGRPGAMARRFGIMYIIWNDRMWRSYDMDRGWTDYSGSNAHTDHIHFSFSWDGAYARTSWWTGKALTTVSYGPLSSTSTGYPTLTVGSYGVYVETAQKVVGTTVDAAFGPATKLAVEKWQRTHWVPVTGKVDTATWNRMVDLGKVPAKGSNQGTLGLAPYQDLTLRLGSRGEAVKALQKALGGLTVDGVFGAYTESAVKAFQKRKGLAVTGVVGPSTWKALMGIPVTTTSTTTTSTTPYTALKGVVLRRGSTGTAVRTLQRGLRGITVDGVFGPATETRLLAFQRTYGIAQTGTTGRATWDTLEKLDYPYLPYYGVVLKVGSRGTAVSALQKGLRITADGVFGSQTETAVKALQYRAGLTRTGVVGILTWKALEAEVRARR